MADHGHHDPGGHELEAINTKLLFRLLISLSLVTLLAAAAVVQWFYSQRRELEGRYAAEGSFQLMDYKTKMSADLEGIDKVAQDMAAKPELLEAPPAPAGWIHPDDLVSGAAAAAPAQPAAPSKPAEPTNEGDEGLSPEPTDAPVEIEKPAEDEPAKPAEDKPAKPAEDKPAKPAEDKPAEDKPAKPADDEPADNG